MSHGASGVKSARIAAERGTGQKGQSSLGLSLRTGKKGRATGRHQVEEVTSPPAIEAARSKKGRTSSSEGKGEARKGRRSDSVAQVTYPAVALLKEDSSEGSAQPSLVSTPRSMDVSEFFSQQPVRSIGSYFRSTVKKVPYLRRELIKTATKGDLETFKKLLFRAGFVSRVGLVQEKKADLKAVLSDSDVSSGLTLLCAGLLHHQLDYIQTVLAVFSDIVDVDVPVCKLKKQVVDMDPVPLRDLEYKSFRQILTEKVRKYVDKRCAVGLTEDDNLRFQNLLMMKGQTDQIAVQVRMKGDVVLEGVEQAPGMRDTELRESESLALVLSTIQQIRDQIDSSQVSSIAKLVLDLQIQNAQLDQGQRKQLLPKLLELVQKSEALPVQLLVSLLTLLKENTISSVDLHSDEHSGLTNDPSGFIYLSQLSSRYERAIENAQDLFWNRKVLYLSQVCQYLLAPHFKSVHHDLQFDRSDSKFGKNESAALSLFSQLGHAIQLHPAAISNIIEATVKSVVIAVNKLKENRLLYFLKMIETSQYLLANSHRISARDMKGVFTQMGRLFSSFTENIKMSEDWVVLYGSLDCIGNYVSKFTDKDSQMEVLKFYEDQLPITLNKKRSAKKVTSPMTRIVEYKIFETLKFLNMSEHESVRAKVQKINPLVKPADYQMPTLKDLPTPEGRLVELREFNQALYTQIKESNHHLEKFIRINMRSHSGKALIKVLKREFVSDAIREEIRRFAAQHTVFDMDNFIDSFVQFILDNCKKQLIPLKKSDSISSVDDDFREDDLDESGETPLPLPPPAVPTRLLPIDELLKKSLNPNSVLSIGEHVALICHFIKEGAQASERLKGSDGVAVYGSTGVGKSTTVCFLHGAKMKHVGEDELEGAPLSLDGYIVVDKSSETEAGELSEIGHTSESKTIVPEVVSVMKSDLQLIDMPGSKDNRGFVYNVVNVVNTIQFLKSASSIKVLFLINYYDIQASRGQCLMEAIDQFKGILGGEGAVNTYQNSILVGVTRANPDELTKLQTVICAYLEKKGIKINSKQVTIVDPLERSQFTTRDLLLGRLDELKEIKDIYHHLTPSLAADDQYHLSRVLEQLSQVDEWLELGDFESVLANYKVIESLHCMKLRMTIDAVKGVLDQVSTAVSRKEEKVLGLVNSDPCIDNVCLMKQLLSQLEKAVIFDDYLNLEERASTRLTGLVSKVKEVEEKKQKAQDHLIDGEFNLKLEQFNVVLQLQVDDHCKSLCDISVSSDLLEIVEELVKINPELALAKRILNLFSEIDKVLLNRKRLYLNPSINSLKEKRAKYERRLRELIKTQLKEAISFFCSRRFNESLMGLEHESYNAILNHTQEICHTQVQLDQVMLIENWGFTLQYINGVNSSILRLDSEGLNELYYEKKARLEDFLKGLYERAGDLLLKQKKEAIFALVDQDPRMDVPALNDQVREIKDTKIYEEVKQYITQFFLEKPKAQLQTLIESKPPTFVPLVPEILAKFERGSEIVSVFDLKTIQEEYITPSKVQVQHYEEERLKLQLSDIDRQFKMKFEFFSDQIQKEMTEAPVQFETSLTSTSGPVEFLEKTQSVSQDRQALLGLLRQIDALLEGFKGAYAVVDSGELKAMRVRWHETMSKLFTSAIHDARGKTVLAGLDERRHEIKEKITKIIQEHKYDFSCHETFLDQMAKFGFQSSELDSFIKIASESQWHPQLQEKALEYKQEMLNSIDLTISNHLIRKINTDVLFSKHRDDIVGLLQCIATHDTNQYQEAVRDLGHGLQQFQSQDQISQIFSAKSYTKLANRYVTLCSLSDQFRSKQIPIVVDVTPFNTRFKDCISILIENAKKEVLEEIVSPRHIFPLDVSESFDTVIRALSSHNSPLVREMIMVVQMGQRTVKQVIFTEVHKKISAEFERLSRGRTDGDPDELSRLALKFTKAHKLVVTLNMDKLRYIQILEEGLKRLPASYIPIISQKLREYMDSADLGTSANDLIQSISFFRTLTIQIYNRKAGTVTVEDVLQRIEGTDLTDLSRGLLSKAFTSYEDEYTNIITKALGMDIDTLKKGALQGSVKVRCLSIVQRLMPHRSHLFRSPELVGRLVANISAIWTILDMVKRDSTDNQSMDLLLQAHNTQLLSIFRLMGVDTQGELESHLAQVKTGEGKSISLGILSTVYALLGFSVNTVCYSSYLSNRDYNEFHGLFSFFNVGFKVQYSTIDGFIEEIMNGSSLPNFRHLVTKYLRGESISSVSGRAKSQKILLVDEVDVFFGESFYGKAYRPGAFIKTEESQSLLWYVWENRDEINNDQESIEKICKLPFVKELLRQYPNLSPLLPYEIEHMISQAKTLKYHRYLVTDDKKIGYQSSETGEVNTSSYFGYSTAFAYIKEFESGEITKDISDHLSIIINAGQILYSELPSVAYRILGLTGSLACLSDGERRLLERYQFNRESLIPTTFDRQTPVQDIPPAAIESESSFRDQIKEDIEKNIRLERPVFVVFETYEKLESFSSWLAKNPISLPNYKTPLILTERLLSDKRDNIIQRATGESVITLMTRTYGRGTDFTYQNHRLEDKGGVHILVTFRPETKAERIQIEGRTCRQDQPGSIRHLYLISDLVRAGFISRSGGRPDLSDLKGDDWESFLESKAKELDENRVERMISACKEKGPNHHRTLNLGEAIQCGDRSSAGILKDLQGYSSRFTFD